jgi:hypothetical protein
MEKLVCEDSRESSAIKWAAAGARISFRYARAKRFHLASVKGCDIAHENNVGLGASSGSHTS